MNEQTKNQIASEFLAAKIKSRQDLDCFKRKISKKYGVPMLKNSELLKIYHEITPKKRGKSVKGWALPFLLRKRPVRSLSGVVNVSVLTKPYPCPGKCIFCPTQKNIPKSYLANEPAVQRAVINKFNPYKQVAMRLKALQETGHPIDKIEIRIIGGTWSYYPKSYQLKFIAECFRACNEFRKNSKLETLNSKWFDKLTILSKVEGQIPKSKIQILKTEQKKNEKAKCRVVGIAVETRPDFITLAEIEFMRQLGITKVELGVQSIYDDVLQKNQRGHNVAATITATRLLKNAGFKVSYQMMPGLYGSSSKKDIKMFKEIFTNPDFMPDYLKIYPLALVKNTKLYNLYKQGKFKPYSEKELTRLLIEIKKILPRWVRVERIIRDIPAQDIVAGNKVLNLREVIQKEMQKNGLTCQCIRCREVKSDYSQKEKLYLFREDYLASGGQEIFLSFENKNRTKLSALLRLRLTEPWGPLAFIRDLHTYGQMAKINDPQGVVNFVQHKGLGKKLIAEAEKIVYAERSRSIAVISGVGVRPYYRKLGYQLKDSYMVKGLRE